MSDPFLGEIRRVAFDFEPRGWLSCNGQILSINANQALFSLLGTVYGGNGVTTFALPDLRGRAPVHPGGNVDHGQVGGAASVMLMPSQIPVHTHGVNAASTAAAQASPQGAYWASTAQPAYGYDTAGVMRPDAIAQTGAWQAHPNESPYQVINYIIAAQGIFPSRG
jgi:microcystin-dependent protein